MMKLARQRGMSKSEAQAWVYAELDRMYPSLEKGTLSPSAPLDDGQIQGLARIPESWPGLPSNAALSAEVG